MNSELINKYKKRYIECLEAWVNAGVAESGSLWNEIENLERKIISELEANLNKKNYQDDLQKNKPKNKPKYKPQVKQKKQIKPKPQAKPKVTRNPAKKKKRSNLGRLSITIIILAIGVFILNKNRFLIEEIRTYAETSLMLANNTNTTNTEKVKEPEMIKIPGGTFQMGSNNLDWSQPIHSVTVSDFYIGKYEVTFEEYDAFCDATGRNRPDDQGWGRGNRPAISVCWEDANAYCQWISKKTGKHYRLPTETEWEYAAGGGNTHQKYAGTNNKNVLNSYAWYRDNSNEKTHPVGIKHPNKFGIYDMTGNVSEWCSYYDNYSSSQMNPQEANSGSIHVYRGGSWNDNANLCNVYLSLSHYPGDSEGFSFNGFRVARN